MWSSRHQSSKLASNSTLHSNFSSTSSNPTNSNSKLPTQKQLQQFSTLKQYNPNGINFSAQYFPFSQDEHEKIGQIPLSFQFTPLIGVENGEQENGANQQNGDNANKGIQSIPRCGSCRAYMNCYNTFAADNKKFNCFFCSRLNYTAQYIPSASSPCCPQLQSPIYSYPGQKNFYQTVPTEHPTLILIFDLNRQAYTSQVLHYAVSAIKNNLENQEWDEWYVGVYGIGEGEGVWVFGMDGQGDGDQVEEEEGNEQGKRQEDFEIKGVKCVIVDKNVNQDVAGNKNVLLKDCRKRLWKLLDYLLVIAEDNISDTSNFCQCWDYIFKTTKNLAPKYIIIQSNQKLSSQYLFSQLYKSPNEVPNPIAPKSFFQTRNKKFFQLYCNDMIHTGSSLSIFIFSKTYKNTRVLTDCLKLTNGQLKFYKKFDPISLQKFYYELYSTLSSTLSSLTDYFVEFIINSGWRYVSVYGNCYRARRDCIVFYCNWVNSGKFIIVVANGSKPKQTRQQGGQAWVEEQRARFLAIQLVINYRYKGKHWAKVVNAVQGVSRDMGKIIGGWDWRLAFATIAKSCIIKIRTQSQSTASNQLSSFLSNIYITFLKYFKNAQNFPSELHSFFLGCLGIKKSQFSQADYLNNTPLFDQINSQRLYLQFCSSEEIWCRFVPYLFDLGEIEDGEEIEDKKDVCSQAEDGFCYPETVEPKFANIKEGLFLLDNNQSLYLYIAKKCSIPLLKSILETPIPIPSKMPLSSSSLYPPDFSLSSSRLHNLVSHLRRQKHCAYKPLQIIHCGEGTQKEKMFYMQFYGEKYDQFREKIGIEQFLLELSRR